MKMMTSEELVSEILKKHKQVEAKYKKDWRAARKLHGLEGVKREVALDRQRRKDWAEMEVVWKKVYAMRKRESKVRHSR